MKNDLLKGYFKSKGFKKKGNYWCLEKHGIWLVVELQRSAYSPGFYLNFGICYEELKGEVKGVPKGYEWHLRSRYEKLINEDRNILIEINLDKEEEASFKLREVVKKIDEIVLPYLEQFLDYKTTPFDFKLFFVQKVTTQELVAFIKKKI